MIEVIINASSRIMTAYACIMPNRKIIPKTHQLQMRAACYVYHHPSTSFCLQIDIGDCEKNKKQKLSGEE